MNRYRNCSVIVIVENRTRLHNVTVYVGKNSIRLMGTTCGVKPYKDFETMKDIKDYVIKLCKNNYFKPRVLATSSDNEFKMYDINWIDINRPFEITRLI